MSQPTLNTDDDRFEERLGVAMQRGVTLPDRDRDLPERIRNRVRVRQRRRRVTYLAVVLLFGGLLTSLSLAPGLDGSGDRSELATQAEVGETAVETDGAPSAGSESGVESPSDTQDQGDKAAAGPTELWPPWTPGVTGTPPTQVENTVTLLLALGLPLMAAALSALSMGGRPLRQRIATAILSILTVQTVLLCLTGIALMFSYQPLPPEITGTSLDSIDQDFAPGIVRSVHAFGVVVFMAFAPLGLIGLAFTLPTKTRAAGIVAGVIVGALTLAWIAEGLLRTGDVVGWDQLAISDAQVGTEIRGVLRPLDIDTVGWRDGTVDRIVSDGETLSIDGYRAAFIDHVLLAGLVLGILGAGIRWTRRSMPTTRLLATVGAWLAAFTLFRYANFVSGALRARSLVERVETAIGPDFAFEPWESDDIDSDIRFDGRTTTMYDEMQATGLSPGGYHLWGMSVAAFCVLSLVGYGLYAWGTDDFRKKRLIHLVPVALVIMTAIVLASTHALSVASSVFN